MLLQWVAYSFSRGSSPHRDKISSHTLQAVLATWEAQYSVQFISVPQSYLTICHPWTARHQVPCSSPTPRACSNSCPFSWWWHPTISSSVVPLSSRLRSFPASRAFPKSHFLASGGQSIGVSAPASVLPMSIQV